MLITHIALQENTHEKQQLYMHTRNRHFYLSELKSSLTLASFQHIHLSYESTIYLSRRNPQSTNPLNLLNYTTYLSCMNFKCALKYFFLNLANFKLLGT
jgi:hypothetical protein